jgi:hypothetical protein
VARNGSVASGCSTAIDDSTASGGVCAPTPAARVTTPTPTATVPGGGGATTTAARSATTGQLARTGADLDGMTAVAIASTALGGVFLALGRRRRPLSRSEGRSGPIGA